LAEEQIDLSNEAGDRNLYHGKSKRVEEAFNSKVSHDVMCIAPLMAKESCARSRNT
jgi:hypothetical protein